ncbi:MAG TPA: ABC transporter permease, partial [Microbacterium sp.]|nr:ABC transporter permease [Microbacterium sp.]
MSVQTSTSPGQAPVETVSPVRRLLSGSFGRNLGLVLALLVLIIVGAVTSSNFLNFDNALVILRQASITGVISIGMTFVIIAGGIDLSVGAVLALASVVASLDAIQDIASSTHWIVTVLVALGVGLGAGLINGVVIAYGKVAAFMATLAMMVGARGLAEILANNRTLVLSDRDFLKAMNVDILGVDILIWIFVVVAVAGWFLLNRTTFGRRTVAIGGNPEAARLAGIKVKQHTMWLYALVGTTAGIAAVMLMGRTTAGTSTHGNLY